MAVTLAAVGARDIRFPTSRGLHGSDAMNPDPDYSAAYVEVAGSDGIVGHGFTFTIGRGNERVVQAIRPLALPVRGLTLDAIRDDMAGFWRRVLDRVRIRAGRYMAPQQAGYSAAMRPESLDEYEFPGGAAWTS